MKFLLALLLVSCASMTEEEKFQREYEEADRKIQYVLWEQECWASGGTVYTDRPHRPCGIRDDCIPHRVDWKYDNEREAAHLGNRTACISKGQLQDIFSW